MKLGASFCGFLLLISCGGNDNGSPSGGGGSGGGGGVAGTGGLGGGSGGSSATTCGPSNCAGCCYGGQCQAGSTAAACGSLGVACATCAKNQICRTTQTCGVDPNSNWAVQLAQASIAPNNNGSAWDADGSAPDVFADLRCPATATSITVATPIVQDSYTPTWTTGSCTMKASALMSDGFAFQLYDSDLLSDDTITNGLLYKVTESDFVAGSITLGPSGGMQSAKFVLTPK